ncbi:hypothetical protein DM992_36300 [Burkholderia sp. JP2-270]|nr:hypothetical protein DM992_36300 [Burkholderia sp. JP2-270]
MIVGFGIAAALFLVFGDAPVFDYFAQCFVALAEIDAPSPLRPRVPNRPFQSQHATQRSAQPAARVGSCEDVVGAYD